MKAWELHHILQSAAELTTAGDLPGNSPGVAV